MTAYALLVSVGTFLYVSTIKILPEVFPARKHDDVLTVKSKAVEKSTNSDIKEDAKQ